MTAGAGRRVLRSIGGLGAIALVLATGGAAVVIAAFLLTFWSFSQPTEDDRRRRWVANRRPMRHARIHARSDPVRPAG